MYFKQFYLGCLSHASYMLGADGVGVVIDPQRDVEQYIEEAHAQGLAIAYVIETHLHADFVSGHRELAERTGAQIVIGRAARASFPHIAAGDGDRLVAGTIELRVFETPGHTPESICVLATDMSGSAAPAKLFTGDTLFIGDVGRPDLSGLEGHSSAEMAALLYESLHEKVLPLDDSTEIYPAHGAGSLCGRNMSSETWSTLGKQRLENYALRPMSKGEFVALMTSALPESPKYFSHDVSVNREGAPPLASLPAVAKLDADEAIAAIHDGALVLDVRPSEVYGPRHIRGSMNVGLDGQFASWAGTLIPLHTPLVVVADDAAAVTETVMRLARVGFTSVIGALAGGIEAWERAGKPIASIPQITVSELAHIRNSDASSTLLDVRRPAEFATGVIRGAELIPLTELESSLGSLPSTAKTYVICGSGYRSSIAASILEARGFTDVVNVDGGMRAYNGENLPTVVPEPHR